ncbi:MAG: sulfur modification protein DndD [Thermoanaerobacterium sp.]|jgi:DNA sulfur modification protein DndD|nr:sulfur modification protein DndD [Thermoanaerobacterium sp.]MDN5301457.1 sulfur modification protein DndD [Thermoanaerobacteraceae bacterium]
MRISEIIIKNFRQFKDVKIVFSKNKEHDLHTIIGRNGHGKTNILNAINWCLYGDQPHLSSRSKLLPLLNMETIEESRYGEIKDVFVQVSITTDTDKNIIIRRKASFRLQGKGEEPIGIGKPELEVITTTSDNDTSILTDDEATNYVERVVPKKIREFFFFDGERLDKYFMNPDEQQISSAVFDISQIYLLQTLIKNLNNVKREIESEATRNNPDLDSIRLTKEQKERDLEQKINEINECKDQIKTSKEIIIECNDYLRGMPDVEDLEKERENLKQRINEIKDDNKTKKLQRSDKLMEFTKLVSIYPSIKYTLNTIDELREKGKIPPNVRPELLNKIITEEHCVICDRALDQNAIKAVEKLLNDIQLSSIIGQILTDVEVPLRVSVGQIKSLKNDMHVLNKQIIENENKLKELGEKVAEIDRKLDALKDKEKIKEKHEQRRLHEKLLETNLERLGQLKTELNSLEKQVKEYKDKFEEAMKKNINMQKLNKQRDFCDKAICVLEKVKSNIMNDTRKRIEEETRNTFFKLLWKKSTFKDVSISENYEISLTHDLGYECLGSISAAERELLALSFTLALHKVSGFSSQLMIDTPVSRVSDDNRHNFGKVLLEVSKEKQIILLFTPDEYSESIQKLFDSTASNRYKLKLSNNEKVASLEVI